MSDHRPECMHIASVLLHNKKRCIYTEGPERWEWHAFTSPHFPYEGDCSSTVTAINFWARGNDPSDLDFAYGNTTTILAHAYEKKLIIQKSELLQGDFVLFGPGRLGQEPFHVVMAIQNNSTHNDPLCFSMGEQGDPSSVPLSVLMSIGDPTYVRNITTT